MTLTSKPLTKSNTNKEQTIDVEIVTTEELDDIIFDYESNAASDKEMDVEATEK